MITMLQSHQAVMEEAPNRAHAIAGSLSLFLCYRYRFIQFHNVAHLFSANTPCRIIFGCHASTFFFLHFISIQCNKSSLRNFFKNQIFWGCEYEGYFFLHRLAITNCISTSRQMNLNTGFCSAILFVFLMTILKFIFDEKKTNNFSFNNPLQIESN